MDATELIFFATKFHQFDYNRFGDSINLKFFFLSFLSFIDCMQERKEGGKRGRKPGRKASTEKIDMKAKLGEFFLFGKCSPYPFVILIDCLLSISERSRQSARECRARKKLRYQYLEELVADREKAVLSLRVELEKVYGMRAHVAFTYNYYSMKKQAP